MHGADFHRTYNSTTKTAAKVTHDSAIIVETTQFYIAHVAALDGQLRELRGKLQAAQDAYSELSGNSEQLNDVYDKLRAMYDELKLNNKHVATEMSDAFEGFEAIRFYVAIILIKRESFISSTHLAICSVEATSH